MKTKHFLILFLISFQISCNAQTNSNKQIEKKDIVSAKSYTENFFTKEISKFTSSKYTRLVGKLFCPVTGLDTLLQKNKYRVAGYDTIKSFYSDKNLYLFFYVETGKELEGLEEYSKADKYINNIHVIFKQQKDSSYLMTDYFYKPLNQGIENYRWTDLFCDSDKRQLHLRQYGELPQKEMWGTELVFTLDNAHKWVLFQVNLYEAENGELWRFKPKHLIWSKKPTKVLPLEEVNYNEYFPYQAIDAIFGR